MATVGVLCARGRVEEKALMAALAEAGIVSALFPCVRAAPRWPKSHCPMAARFRAADRDRSPPEPADCAGGALRLPRPGGARAERRAGRDRDRLDVASVLERAGLPRPRTAPAPRKKPRCRPCAPWACRRTLLPLDLQSCGITLRDEDAAEAILEHRAASVAPGSRSTWCRRARRSLGNSSPSW